MMFIPPATLVCINLGFGKLTQPLNASSATLSTVYHQLNRLEILRP